MRRLSLCTLACATLVSACSPLAFFTKSGGPCAKRAPDCTFDVISSRPVRQYQIIGVIDVDAFSVRSLPNDEASFRRTIGKAVCKAGGDAVIPGVNGDRRYVLATVVKWVDDERKTPICPVPPPKLPHKKGDKGASDAGTHDAGTRAADAGAGQMDTGPQASAAGRGLGAAVDPPWSPQVSRPAHATRGLQGGAPC